MHPAEPSLPKPAVGAPCNGCGLCCRIRVCSAGSYALHLVDRYGDRVDGPCPALSRQQDGTWACGIMLRPREWLDVRGGAHDLRREFGLLIGLGAGCDEAGDEPDETALPALGRIGEEYLDRVGRERIAAAWRRLFGER